MSRLTLKDNITADLQLKAPIFLCRRKPCQIHRQSMLVENGEAATLGRPTLNKPCLKVMGTWRMFLLRLKSWLFQRWVGVPPPPTTTTTSTTTPTPPPLPRRGCQPAAGLQCLSVWSPWIDGSDVPQHWLQTAQLSPFPRHPHPPRLISNGGGI